VVRQFGIRLLHLVIVFVLVAALGFMLLHLAPGDPAQLKAGLYATPAQIAAARHQLGLDKPFVVQLWNWLRGLPAGNFGQSYTDAQPVSTIIAQCLPASLQLSIMAFVIIVIVAVPLGVISAVRRNGISDRAGRGLALFGLAVPNFVLGLLLVFVFGWWIPNLLPYEGYVSFASNPVSAFEHTLLPAVALALTPIGLVSRLTRTSMLEVLDQDYIVAAQAFGVPRRTIIWRDAVKNGVLPVITALGLVFGFLLSGAVVVETVFSIPGLGRQLIQSFGVRDYPVAIGVMLVFAIGFLVMNLIADVVAITVNPRLRRLASSES
jgi:peptide/nickel transport system permease protein